MKKNFDNDLTEEYILSLSDYQLRTLFTGLRAKINRLRRNKKNSKEAEKDFCYVQLEMALRKSRKNLRMQKNKK
jgi:hypothetical protein